MSNNYNDGKKKTLFSKRDRVFLNLID